MGVMKLLKLEEVRKQKNMNQAELARRIGCSQAAICKFESGDMKPSFDTFVKMAQVLECSLDELVDRTESVSSAS